MSTAGAPSRLQRLLGFLRHDPTNPRLIADAANAAVDEGEPAQAAALLDSYARISPLTPELMNLRGLAALDAQRHDEARATFEALLQTAPEDPNLRFNLAWCRSMLPDYEGAAALLDDAVMDAAPRAPWLRIQMLHHLGRLEEALEVGQGLAVRFPHDADLMGALAAVALDAEDLGLAADYARRAGDQHDGLFERALAAYPQDARARLGKGLALMAQGASDEACGEIDRAAELFGRHLGSWVAAGWAYFVKGDYATSRARFETALAIDDTFAEIHGGLAVLDVMDGEIDRARRRIEVALRLDRNCFSAALARVLILSRQGDAASAARVRDIALNTPIGAGGRTIAQVMASFAAQPGRRRS